MQTYFAGNTTKSFDRTQNAIIDDTTSGRFDSAYVQSGVNLYGGGANFLYSPDFAATGTAWFHWEVWTGTAPGNGFTIWQIDNGATAVLRIQQTNSTSTPPWQLQYWNGSSWVAIGSANNMTQSTKYQIDVRVTLNGSAEWFINEVSIASGSISGQTACTKARWGTLGLNTCVSQMIGCDTDTRDMKYMTAALTADSAANTGQASGTYAEVGETSLDDGTFEKISVSGNKAGQVHAALTIPPGYVIAAGVFNARAKISGAITDGKIGVRSGGANYSSSAKAFSQSIGARHHVVENNPATGAPFTQSGFNAAESYFEAV